MQRLKRAQKAFPSLRYLGLVFTTLMAMYVKAEASIYYLEGVGYREQALQQAKTSFFQSEDPNGILYASFGGGTNIFIQSPELNENPQLNQVYFTSVEFNNAELPGPALNEDDAFNSNPLLGFITYRMPAPHELFGVTQTNLEQYEELNFYLSVKAPDIFGEEQHFTCQVESRCRIRFQRRFTPRVFYLSPPVLFYEAYTQIFFDPKNTLYTVQNLKSDEMAFVNTEIGGSKLDFEYLVDSETSLSYWGDNQVMGQVGPMPIGHSDKDIKMLWEVGYAQIAEHEATHCTYNMDRCYQAMNVPVIFNISQHTGYTSGGQNLTIHGFGFNSPNISVTVAGVDCQVTQYQHEYVSCQVQQAVAPSTTNTSQAGAHGLRREFHNHTNLTWANQDTIGVYAETLLTQFEVPTNIGDKIGNNIKGWFVAPETTKYRFHLACDDICELNMGLNTADPLTTTKIVSSLTHKGTRSFYTQQSDAISDWVDLVKDEKYYIQGRHYESSYGDNFAVGVEIQQSAIPNHHHSVKEVQYVEAIIQNPTYDTTRLRVSNVAAGGTFYLAHQNPFNLTNTLSGNIAVGDSAATLRNKIKFYYSAIYGSDIDVNRTMYLQNGTETTDSSLAYTHVYHIRLMKLINGTSVANIQVISSTSAQVTVELPSVVMTSSQPLSGKFRVTCPGPTGNDIAADPYYSNEITVGDSGYWFARSIYLNCSGTYDKLQVWRNYTNMPYGANGVGYFIRFIGMSGSMPQMKIVSSSDDPLLGDYVISQAKMLSSSTNIFYPAIPFEMIRTYETNPQVIVKVGDYPAVCKNLSCDYNYTIPQGEVTGFTYNANTRVLQLTGVDLPINSSMVDYVEFGHSTCTLNSVSSTSISCTLVYEPVCGDHLPKLVSIYGLVNNTAALTAETITCSISSITPTTDLNLMGGDNLTFTGLQFPWNLETSTVDIQFTDTQSTKCTPQTSTSTSLVCLTSAFDQTLNSIQSVGLTVVINGQTVSNSLSLSTMQTTKSGMSMNPTSANPTLKTQINITLESDFPYQLDKSDFSVNATNISNPSYFRQMNVIGVDDASKTITCMFGGAWSGLYKLDIRHKSFGLVDASNLQFTVGSNVTSISPNTGSIYGGTLITITGTNFGREFTDNPVQIASVGGIEMINCYLQSISETQITCRLDKTTKSNGNQGKLVVFLKTSEEAPCYPSSACDYTYTSTVPTLNSISTVWDSTNNYWTVQVSGTGFTGTSQTTELQVNGRTQTTISVTSNLATFRVSNITGWVLNNIKVYFDVGIPAGHDSVVDGKSFELSPKLVSVSPNAGSVGGSLLVANLQGLGEITASTPSGDLIDMDTGNSICQTFKVRSYGVVECLTTPGVISSGTRIGAKSLSSQLSSECSNTNTALCAYEQLTGSSMPVVTSISNSPSNTIIYTGTDFFTSGYTGHASFDGVLADSVTIDSATQVTAVWNQGLPPSGTSIQPKLWFSQTGTDVLHYASSTSTLTLSLSVTSSSNGLQCSFAGGCNLEVNAEGLSSLLKNDTTNNYITVCDEKCIFDEVSSTSTKAVCRMPPISTVYSNQNYQIETTREDLRFRQIFGNLVNNQLVFDNHLTVRPTISGQSECYIGGSFKADHVGMLSQVKYFMGDIQDKTKYVSILKFQGSNDNSTWNDLFAADENIHEGWNYHKWDDSASQPKYRFYRFYNPSNGLGCDINEMKMTGVETVDNSQSTYTCQVTIQKSNVTIQSLTNTVDYTNSLTPKLVSMDPRFGTVTGGTSVTFTGTNFVSDTSKYSIKIDGRTCSVTAATSTSVTCTTDHRPGLISPSLEILIDGYGLVANQQQLFRYVSMWSDDTTWGGEFAPMYGESIYIPEGLNLMVDIDSTPELNLVMVEGSLIFAPDSNPQHERFFDANYIFLNKAYMEVGTESHPYTSKLTITMHGNISSPYLPIFGNKCIAVKESTLDMHGVQRTPTWTVLHETALPGATQIKLSGQVDWEAGEEIAIASTSFDGREGEKRVIASIDKSNPQIPVVTLDRPLDFKHFAMIQTYGSDSIDMRAEVGLLTRNVKYRGDPETSFANQYGATIFLHSEGDDSLVARLEYIELTDVGQAFKVGRYAVHFHMIGAVHKSYCKGFGTHQGFNRAFTLHGTHYMRIMENVAYDILGHTIFIEDAVEKKNYIYKNLVMKAKRSWSLLNTDQTPACFWITNPDNSFIENHCGGSDRYGYWYDLQTHAIGPHANTNVCPENERVGEFRDNHAHSCGRYGLRIFHNMIPRTYPCKPVVYDHNNLTDPWWQNPPITAHFYRLTSWKNGRNGAIAEKVGDVRFHDFKVADNRLAGIEFSLTDDYGDNTTRIDNALIIGKTLNTEEALENSEPYGIIGPRTENFRVDGARFYNFNWNEAAALSSCSHCFHPAATDSGARTIRFSNLTFDSSVHRIANYQYPWRAIFLDEDGTLTGKGPGSWATPYYPHHNQTGCEHNPTYYGGVFCDSSVQVRRVAFHGLKPAALFAGMGFKILRYDDAIVNEYGNKTEYLANKTHYATMFYKEKLDPTNGWAVPFVTGHKYKIHFGMTGLDYEELIVDVSERWEASDLPIYFVHNWTDVRMAIDFRVGGSTGYLVDNNTIPANQNDWHIGHNVVYNETAVRETHFVVSGKNESNPYQRQRLHHKGHRCIGSCSEYIEEVPQENFLRYWANATDWPSGKVPEEGEDVHIEPGWNMIFNMNPSPVYKLIRINGNLTFDNVTDTHLKAKHIFIRAGELHIGSQEYPMQMNARITLYGEKNMETIVYDNAIEAGNKLIANVNKIRMFGKQPSWKMTRLLSPALRGSNTFTVEAGLQIQQGDRLGLLPTSYDPDTVDDVFVQSYDSASGLITINSTLNYYHWGQQQTTGYTHNGLDMRGEVLLLTRNIKIDAEDIESWGGQIVTSDTVEVFGETIIQRVGTTIMDSVEIFNCSQIDTFKGALRFQSATQSHSSVTNSAIHNGYAWGLHVIASANIFIKDNIFFRFRPIGVGIQSSRNITFDNNIIGGIVDRTTIETGDQVVDKAGAVSVCAYQEGDSQCTDIYVRNNIVGGSVYGGFVTYGHKCGDYSSRFEGNIAHSIRGFKSGNGLYFKNHPSESDCTEYSNFFAYKCYYQGAFAYPTSKRLVMTQMTMVDNRQGAGASIVSKANEYDQSYVDITYNDFKIYGEYGSPDCPQNGQGGFCHKYDKFGMLSALGTWNGKDFHINAVSPLPPFKVKSISSWITRVEIHRTQFINFKGQTEQGMRQRAFELNPYGSDDIPMQEFYDTIFQNIEDEALGLFFEPPQGWAIIKDCGNFPCTAPKNTIYSFKRNLFTGLRPSYAAENFQMIPDTPNFSEHVPNCEKWENMNLWTCNQDRLGLLYFESEDPDTLDRSMQPIFSRLQGTTMNNKVNSYMDHVWDGFYTGQTRLSRFPILVYAPWGAVYDIVYTGTPARRMKYSLASQERSLGLTVRIAYPSAESRQILLNGQRVDMNPWDENLMMYGPVKQTKCGENRYIGVQNILEFYLTQGCVLQIAPRDAIQTMVRLEWSMDDFFASGGTTTFMDRVASSLGIHASTIKTVSVYEGSVIVNYDIVAADSDSKPEETLQKLHDKQIQKYSTGKMNLGAPILDVQTSLTKSSDVQSATVLNPIIKVVQQGVVSAPGYDPLVLTKVDPVKPGSEDVYIPDIPQINQDSSLYQGQSYQDATTTQSITGQPSIVTNVNKYENTKIVNIDDKDVTIIQGDGQTALIIIVIGVVALFIIALVLGVRFLFNRLRKEQAQAEHIKQTQMNLNKDTNIKVIPREKEPGNKAQFDQVINTESPEKVERAQKDNNQLEYLEEQYDPNQEFKIFGVGDKTKGGVQSLQEKMNMADNQNSDRSSDDEQQQQNKVDDSQLRASHMSNAKLMQPEESMIQNPQSKNTPLNSLKSSDIPNNALPEDQEIHNDD